MAFYQFAAGERRNVLWVAVKRNGANMNPYILCLYRLSLALCMLAQCDRCLAGDTIKRPNVIVIMTDNHGAWTLGCYGNPEIRTPNIDRLAAEGVQFNHAYANNAVCSPTCASFLTGLMPSQHGVHRFISGRVMWGPDAYSTIEEFKSLPEIFQEAGYTCGLVGKWHLGAHSKPQEGFTYWLAKEDGHTPGFYNDRIIENGKVRREPSHLTPFWTRHARQFIKDNKEQPFFLYLAYNGPYSLGTAIMPEPTNRHAAYYADKPMTSFPRVVMHPWMYSPWQKPHVNNITSMRNTASQISLIDDGVGEVMDELKQQGLDQNTLIVFLADQGFAGGHGGFWGMGDHTRPLTARDQCMHIPLIVHQPGKIKAGVKSDHHVANYDVYPSLLNHLGLADKIPRSPERPGRNFAPVLRGEHVEWDDSVFYEFENIRVIRTKDWKYVERIGDERHELYDLQNDPGESKNLIDDAAQHDMRQQLRARLAAFYKRYSDPKWDLWNGGDAKGGLLLGKEPYVKK